MNTYKRLLKLTLSVLMMMILSTTSYSAEHEWIHDYDQAVELAQKEKKDIYLFIGADACKFCKKYKEQTLSDKAVMKRLTKEYIPVYLSRDQHLIPDNFETMGVPRHYFLKADGTVYFSTQGLLEIAGFYTMLDEAELMAPLETLEIPLSKE